MEQIGDILPLYERYEQMFAAALAFAHPNLCLPMPS
jgi:hypothetical protein